MTGPASPLGPTRLVRRSPGSGALRVRRGADATHDLHNAVVVDIVPALVIGEDSTVSKPLRALRGGEPYAARCSRVSIVVTSGVSAR